MSYSYNLVDQKWIPCVHFDGRVEEFSLRQVIAQAHQLRGIQGDSPLETAALYRLLLAVLHSALRGPRNKHEWGQLWKNGDGSLDQSVFHNYLDAWRHRFDLFHSQKPFYQAADERANKKSVITLVMDMASGNNAALFDHHTETEGVSLSPGQAARALIVAQAFGLAGLWLPGITFTDAPWGRGIIFFVEGDTLFNTLALNLINYPEEKIPNSSDRVDQPAWEKDDPYQPLRQIPEGYLDYLTWPSRRIYLLPEANENAPIVRSMTMAPGLRLDSSIRDPMKLYRKAKKEGYLITRFSADRALWRDSDSFFRFKSEKGIESPRNFGQLAVRFDSEATPSQQQFRCMALGMANDQAKVEFFHQEHLPLPLKYLKEEALVEKLVDALNFAEETRFALKIASQWMALLVIKPPSDGKKWEEIAKTEKEQAEKLAHYWNVDRFYWQQLEIYFLHFFEDMPTRPEALESWKETLRRTAWSALEQAINLLGTDSAALKAAVRARSILGYSLKELFPELKKETTV